MVEDAGEQYYAELYLDHILPTLPGPALDVLDAGCQAGRFALPLARMGHRVTGVDISDKWLQLCASHCRAQRVAVDLRLGDIREVVQTLPAASCDVIVCTELLYVLRDPPALLAAFRRLLRPGGVLYASHRTRYYMLATMARFRRFDAMEVAAVASEGELLGHYFNWYDEDELAALYAQAGYAIRQMAGIGVVSGTGVDGAAGVIDPATLDAPQRARLMAAERACAARYPHVARYRLITAVPVPERKTS